MDSMTHFHSKNLYFFVHYSYSLNVTALPIFKISGLTPTVRTITPKTVSSDDATCANVV